MPSREKKAALGAASLPADPRLKPFLSKESGWGGHHYLPGQAARGEGNSRTRARDQEDIIFIVAGRPGCGSTARGIFSGTRTFVRVPKNTRHRIYDVTEEILNYGRLHAAPFLIRRAKRIALLLKKFLRRLAVLPMASNWRGKIAGARFSGPLHNLERIDAFSAMRFAPGVFLSTWSARRRRSGLAGDERRLVGSQGKRPRRPHLPFA